MVGTSPFAGDVAERGSAAASAAAVGDGHASGDLPLGVGGESEVDDVVVGDAVPASRAVQGGYEGAGGSVPIRLNDLRSGL